MRARAHLAADAQRLHDELRGAAWNEGRAVKVEREGVGFAGAALPGSRAYPGAMSTTTGSAAAQPDTADPPVKPQTLMLTILAIYVLGRPVAVSSASLIEALRRVGVSEHAVRSTLTRMTSRGLLARYPRGRRMYFGLTARSTEVLADGRRRIWQTGAINRDWDGTWTVVAFSLPASWHAARHDLRSRLIWRGFGPLQSGLWISPAEVDVAALLGGLDLDAHVKVLTARVGKPTEAQQLIHAAFDLDAIKERYLRFMARWGVSRPLPGAADDLARQLFLHSHWLQTVGHDPHLPAAHLPADWPAIAAEKTFRRLAHSYDPRAAEIIATFFDTIDTPAPTPGTAGDREPASGLRDPAAAVMADHDVPTQDR